MVKYAKFMCSCGLALGAPFHEGNRAYCSRCKKDMKYKMMKNLDSDKEWNSIKYEDCK